MRAPNEIKECDDIINVILDIRHALHSQVKSWDQEYVRKSKLMMLSPSHPLCPRGFRLSTSLCPWVKNRLTSKFYGLMIIFPD
jgi:hypothetical protein